MKKETSALVGQTVRLCANQLGFYCVTRGSYLMHEKAEVIAAGSHTSNDGRTIEVVTLRFPPIGNDKDRTLVVQPEYVAVAP